MKTRIALYGLGFIALIVALSVASWAWRYYTAPIRGKVAAEEQIESAPSRIANYEHFFDLCASVQRKERKITAQQQLLATSEDAKEKRRIRQNIAALQGARAGDIARYNADAAKSYTRARFHASNLPARLEVEAGSTTCAYGGTQ